MAAVPQIKQLSSRSDVKVLAINVEDVFGPQPKVDLDDFLQKHSDITFTVGQDLTRASIETLLKPAQRKALPTGKF